MKRYIVKIVVYRCGGHKYGTEGEFRVGADGSVGCEWLLRTPVGKGIILDLSGIQSAVFRFVLITKIRAYTVLGHHMR